MDGPAPMDQRMMDQRMMDQRMMDQRRASTARGIRAGLMMSQRRCPSAARVHEYRQVSNYYTLPNLGKSIYPEQKWFERV